MSSKKGTKFDEFIKNSVEKATTPPQGVWDKISNAMDIPVAESTGAKRTSMSKPFTVVAIVGIVATVATATLLSVNHTTTVEQPPQIQEFTGNVHSDTVQTAVTVEHTDEEYNTTAQAATEKHLNDNIPYNETSLQQDTLMYSVYDSSLFAEIATTTEKTEIAVETSQAPTEEPNPAESEESTPDSTQYTPAPRPQTHPTKVDIERSLLIPNLITPNGDGINDCWVIKGTDGFGTVRVEIFNAQGKRVYSSKDYKNDFCGGNNPSGNYFYIISLPSHNYSRRGALVIMNS